MGLLLFQYRKQNLIQDQNNVEYQLVDLNQQLMDSQNLSATLANDSITMSDMASMPCSLFSFGMGSLMQADVLSRQYADQTMSNIGGSVFDQYGDNKDSMMYIAWKKAYEQGREQYKKRMQMQLNQQEKQIQMKKTKLETRLACIEKELEGISQQLPNKVAGSISNFGLQG